MVVVFNIESQTPNHIEPCCVPLCNKRSCPADGAIFIFISRVGKTWSQKCVILHKSVLYSDCSFLLITDLLGLNWFFFQDSVPFRSRYLHSSPAFNQDTVSRKLITVYHLNRQAEEGREDMGKHSSDMFLAFIDSVPYLEKKRLLDRQEEIQEVKQLDEWKPAVGIFTAVLEGLDDNAG